ncbi:MAG: hypothetical protein SGCHY_002827 [Lobulomycetales sp.]
MFPPFRISTTIALLAVLYTFAPGLLESERAVRVWLRRVMVPPPVDLPVTRLNRPASSVIPPKELADIPAGKRSQFQSDAPAAKSDTGPREPIDAPSAKSETVLRKPIDTPTGKSETGPQEPIDAPSGKSETEEPNASIEEQSPTSSDATNEDVNSVEVAGEDENRQPRVRGASDFDTPSTSRFETLNKPETWIVLGALGFVVAIAIFILACACRFAFAEPNFVAFLDDAEPEPEWVDDPVPRYKNKGSPESEFGTVPSYMTNEEPPDCKSINSLEGRMGNQEHKE